KYSSGRCINFAKSFVIHSKFKLAPSQVRSLSLAMATTDCKNRIARKMTPIVFKRAMSALGNAKSTAQRAWYGNESDKTSIAIANTKILANPRNVPGCEARNFLANGLLLAFTRGKA